MAIEADHKYAVVWVEADGSERSVGFYFRKTAIEYASLVKSVNNGRDVRIGFGPSHNLSPSAGIASDV